MSMAHSSLRGVFSSGVCYTFLMPLLLNVFSLLGSSTQVPRAITLFAPFGYATDCMYYSIISENFSLQMCKKAYNSNTIAFNK